MNSQQKLDLALICGSNIDTRAGTAEMSWSSSTRPRGSSVNVDDGGLGWGGTNRNAPSTGLGASLRPIPTTLVPTSDPWRPIHADGWGRHESTSALTMHVPGWGTDAARPWWNPSGDSYGEHGSGARFAGSPNRFLDSLAPAWDHLASPQIRVNGESAYDTFHSAVSTSPVCAPRPSEAVRRGECLAPGSVSPSAASPCEDDFHPSASQHEGGETATWCRPKVSSLSTPAKSGGRLTGARTRT